MSNNLSLIDKAFLEGVFNMGGGYVLNFSNASFEAFFGELNIAIYDDEKYQSGGSSNSKANRLRAFWKSARDEEIALSLNAFSDYIETKKEAPIAWGDPVFSEITTDHIKRIREIAKNLSSHKKTETDPTVTAPLSSPVIVTSEATVTDNEIQIEINEDIYSHIQPFLKNEDYFHAVEEAYKVVREKLREKTGHETAANVFNMNAENKRHFQKLFGKVAGATEAENNFMRGTGYLHLAIQFLRNEKAHSLAAPLDPNLAVHYISLASLAYDLITKHVNPEDVQQIEEAVTDKRSTYKNANLFYAELESGKCLNAVEIPVKMTRNLRKALKEKWLDEAQFNVSYDKTNVLLMRLTLVAEELHQNDIDTLLDLPTKDSYGNEQGAGILEFLNYIHATYPEKYSHKASDWVTSQTQEL